MRGIAVAAILAAALVAAEILSAPAALAADPFPAAVGGPFRLVDQDGAERTGRDPGGRLQLLFFGYANCREICSVALPAMAEAVTALAAQGIGAVPVMITIDPGRDEPGAMGAALRKLHPDFVGLTGDDTALAAAWAAFGVERSLVFTGPEGPVWAHGSFVWLLDGEGRVLSVLPPILSPERIAEIARARAGG